MDRIKNIKDLAIIAGVSAGTVSRALAGSELISHRTRERIKAIADEHGFRPNVLARNLRIQRTGAIGVLVPLRQGSGNQISDPFYISMLGLIADALTERGYDLLLSRVFPADAHWLNHFVTSGRTDGALLLGQSDQLQAIESVAESYRPMVVWGGGMAGQRACTVGSDNRLGGALAGQHLVERGSKRPAFVGDSQAVEPLLRLEGFRAALQDAGIAPQVFGSRAELAEALAKAPGSADRPDGVFAATDAIAASILLDAAHAGLSVPDDLRVVGYDGLSLGEQVAPQLTTIDQDMAQGARILVDLLLRRIGGEDAESVTLEPRLLVRHSS